MWVQLDIPSPSDDQLFFTLFVRYESTQKIINFSLSPNEIMIIKTFISHNYVGVHRLKK